MAESRFFVNLNGAKGNNDNTATLSLCSGNILPSNAVLTSVKYRITMSINSGTIGNWNTKYLTLGYGSPSISDYSISSSLTSSGTALDSFGNTFSSSNRWTYGTDLSFSQSDVSVFSQSNISLSVRANCSGSATSFIYGICIYVTYTVPSLSWNTKLTASQVNDQVKLTWDSSPTYSGGTGSCLLSVHNGISWVAVDLSANLRSYTLTPIEYGTSIVYAVRALYSDLEAIIDVSFTASAPAIEWNNSEPTVTENDDGTLTIAWNVASGSWGSSGSSVSYKLYEAPSSSAEGTLIGAYTSACATIDAPSKDSYYYVVVTYSTKSSTSGRTYYAAHRTVKRWNGSSWDECIAYYYNGSSWPECVPYRYNGTGWDLLSH